MTLSRDQQCQRSEGKHCKSNIVQIVKKILFHLRGITEYYPILGHFQSEVLGKADASERVCVFTWKTSKTYD